MSNSDKKIQNGRVKIPGSELTMPAPPPEAHWTVYKITGPDGKVYIGQTGQPLKVRWRKGYQTCSLSLLPTTRPGRRAEEQNTYSTSDPISSTIT